MDEMQQLTEAVEMGNLTDAKRLTDELLKAGKAPLEIVEQGLSPGMANVGEKFKSNQIFVPEMLIAARAMKEAMSHLEPLLVRAGITPKYTVILGTVQGDLHDIGKNLVGMLLKGANIRVVDLGINVTPDQFVAAVKEHNASIVGLSALLTTTMLAMKTTIKALRAAGYDSVKVLIGGAPVTAQFAEEIGADGYAPDAASAVDMAKKLVTA
ncbi:MAG: corrinoid protein [Phycisphaeraceae bacterium]|nr:corrinoid protein [Phycisphaeraceae bacterium]